MMQLPALIEPLGDRPGYRGRLGEPFNLTVEAATKQEVYAQLTVALRERLTPGAEVVGLPVDAVRLPPAGELPDDELTHIWREGVQAYRQECDAEDRRHILGEPLDEEKAAS